MNDAQIHAMACSIEEGEWFGDTQDMLAFARLVKDAALAEYFANRKPVLYTNQSTLDMQGTYLGAWRPGTQSSSDLPLFLG